MGDHDPEALASAWRAWHEAPDDGDHAAAYRAAASAARTGPLPLVGEIVADRYQLGQHLADGPLTARWEATDLHDESDVYVEILHSRFLAVPGTAERFHDAARTQAELEIEGIATVRQAGDVWEGFHWVATDHGGKPLASALPELDPTARRQVLLDIGEALVAAHEAGVPHGAIEPENILVGPQGAAVLTGFGQRAPVFTGSLFAAPESADPGFQPSATADRYALAMLVAWVELDGELPYWAMRDPVGLLGEFTPPDTLAKALEGSWALRAEDRPEGISDLVRCLRGDADQVRALAERAVAFERWDAALGHYRQLLALTRGDADVRADLAVCLARSGKEEQATDQLYAALRSRGLKHEQRVIDELRRLVEPSGEVEPLIEALEERALQEGVRADLLMLEAARLRERRDEGAIAAWDQALHYHRHREQAHEALRHLVRHTADRGDWVAFVNWGRQLVGYEPESTRARLAFRIGEAYQTHLRNPNGALLWLRRALDEGYDDPDLHAMLEALQSERGDWGELQELLVGRADEAEEADDRVAARRRAARIARRAMGQAEQAEALYRQVLDDIPDDTEALLYLARSARDAGDTDAERDALTALMPMGRDELSPHQRVDAALRLATLWRGDDELSDALDLAGRILEEAPGHSGALALRIALLRDRGRHQEALPLLDRMATSAPAGTEPWVQGLMGLAELLWRYGEVVQSYRIAEDVLRHRPHHGPAHWAAARAALSASPLRDELAVDLSHTHFTPQEALARLLDFLIDVDALHAYADTDRLGPPLGRSSLERASCAVDRLCAHDAVDEVLFTRLTELCPEQAEAIRMVERLWEPAASPSAFPIGLTYSWQRVPPSDDDVQRSVVSGPQPASVWQGAASDADLDILMVASERSTTPAADPTAPVPAAVALEPETLALVVHPGDVRQVVLSLTEVDRLTIGGDVDDNVFLDGVPPARVAVERAGDHYYVVGEGLTVDGLDDSDRRLADGLQLQVDGVPLKVVGEAEAEELAGDDLTDFLDEVEESEVVVEEEEAPTLFEMLPDDVPTALVYARDDDEFLLPLVDEITDLPDGATLRKEEDGWRLTHGPMSRFVVHGEHFTLDGTTYTVARVESVAPEIAPPTQDDLVPSLIMDDGSLLGKVIPLAAGATTIGRGRSVDIKIRNDAKVSRKHATLEVRAPDDVTVVDHGSSNGTFIGETQVEGSLPIQPGQTLQVGDTMFEFRLRADESDEEEEEELAANDTLMGSTSLKAAQAQLSLADGRARMEVANRALGAMLATLDSQDGAGAGRAELQLLIDVAPRRFKAIFQGVDVKRTGLPELRVLFNVATCSEASQRATLVGGLLDLIERTAQRFADLIDDETTADEMLEAVARTNYRKHLRL